MVVVELLAVALVLTAVVDAAMSVVLWVVYARGGGDHLKAEAEDVRFAAFAKAQPVRAVFQKGPVVETAVLGVVVEHELPWDRTDAENVDVEVGVVGVV